MRWVFERDSQTISLYRTMEADACVLTVRGSVGATSRHSFPDIFALTVAQVQFEGALVDQGWALADMIPTAAVQPAQPRPAAPGAAPAD